jgi:hypothetical protein
MEISIPDMSIADFQSYVEDSVIDELLIKKETFCKHFALIARIAGWRWNFDEHAPIHDEILATYTSLMYEITKLAFNNADKHHDWHANVSQGRISMMVIYFVKTNSLLVKVTADII